MNTGIIVLIIILSAGLGVFVFFLVKSLAAPRQISTLKDLVNQGKSVQAIRAAKAILIKTPRSNDAHWLLAQAYKLDGKPELALMEFKTVNQISDFTGLCKEGPFRKEIAELFIQFGQEEEALKEYLLLMKLEPYNADHFYQAGKLFESRGKGGQAAGLYRKGLEINPRNSECWMALGHLLFRAKRGPEAKDALQKALKLRPDNYKAHFFLGRLHKEARNFTAALASFENAQKDPDYKLKALIERGSCFLALKTYDKAQAELERAIKVGERGDAAGEILHARYFLSLCYEKIRNIDRAIEQWEAIYTAKPNFRDVAEKLSQYQELRGDDTIKDFITASPEKFEKTCQALTGALNMAVTDQSMIADGCQIVAVDRSTGPWRNTRKFPKMIRIMRVPENIDLPQVRDFHEEMRRAGVSRGYFITSSAFTRSAYEFVEQRPVDLIDRSRLQELLKKAESESQAAF